MAAKDAKKLEIARNLADPDEAKQIAEDVLRDMFSHSGRLKPAWQELVDSDLTGDDVTDLVESMFLYAVRALQHASPGEATWLFEEHEKMWASRLPSAAMALVRKTYFDKIRPLSLAAFKGEQSV